MSNWQGQKTGPDGDTIRDDCSQSRTHRKDTQYWPMIDHTKRLGKFLWRVGFVVIGTLIVAVAAGTAVSSLLGGNIGRPEPWVAATLVVALATIFLAAFGIQRNRMQSKSNAEYTKAIQTFAEEYKRHNERCNKVFPETRLKK